MSGLNDTRLVNSGYGGGAGHTAYEMRPPPMIGVLPATTVVYILLGLGALLPVLLLAVVALTLCVRRRTHHKSTTSSSAVVPLDLTALATGYHHSNAQQRAGVGDDEVFFSAKKWAEKRRDWDEDGPSKQQTAMMHRDFGMDHQRKRMHARIGADTGKVEVHSAQNPNVYFRYGRPPPPPKIGDPALQYGSLPALSSQKSVQLKAGELIPYSNYRRQHELSTPSCDVTSCDVTVTSSSSSPSDAGSSGNVVTSSGGSSQRSATPTLERDLSMTRSTLQREEEHVLR